MKNAMKKLMSLLLVAVLLIGALPFAASAAEGDCTIALDCPHTGVQHDPLCPKTCDKSVNCPHTGVHHTPDCASIACTNSLDCPHKNVYHVATCPAIPCNGTATCPHPGNQHAATCLGIPCDGTLNCPHKGTQHVATCASIPCDGTINCPHKSIYHAADCAVIKKQEAAPEAPKVETNGVACTKSYSCQHVGNQHIAGCPMIPCTNNANCDHGGWNHLATCPKASTGCNLSANCQATLHNENCVKYVATNTNNGTTKPGVVGDEWMKDIWLYIYVNNDIIQPAKRILLNNYTIVADHTLSQGEILTVVDDYYRAANANTGIVWKGAYRETTNITALDFVAGLDETTITGLDVDRSLNTVIIKARVTGVNAIGGGVADGSNPKTGDTIYTAMVVMGISAASLAAVMYFYNKKRMAI